MAEAGAYLRLAAAWFRSAAQYPLSLALLTLSQVGAAMSSVLAIVFVFGHARVLSGFDLGDVLFLYALSGLAFGLADFAFGSVEQLGTHIRTGTLDTMLVRPVSVLVQIAVDRFSPRRLGKVVPAAITLCYALPRLDTDWTPARIAMVPATVLCGAAICTAIWILGASLQFYVTEAREAANSVTYGGSALTEYPLSIYGQDVMRVVTFVVPLAFVNWQPALFILDRPDPLGLPEWVRFAAPAVAVALLACAALVWRTGMRRYASTGS
ncbi:ABC transporter permease [Allonocardiopsis opalescens]|uniref:ABC-2 type transport system permease protein n=1 Tax=Allonocardiopsis opalescens TaxID=1144618 RepID=A0A2T0Q4N2_9ACTN|nr:ABC-2 family transporter protein [Allonocardiopsis opalescens]PRX98709.1 ABC-2 type transport system permease protein [Allonocardiopsis opalescens]